MLDSSRALGICISSLKENASISENSRKVITFDQKRSEPENFNLLIVKKDIELVFKEREKRYNVWVEREGIYRIFELFREGINI